MKLFSGGGGHNSDNKKTRNVEQQKAARPPAQFSGTQSAPHANIPTNFVADPGRQPARQPAHNNGTAPKPSGRGAKKKSVSDKKRRGRRIVVAIMIALTLLIAGTATAVYFLVRPPEIAQPKNDPTIKDPENGDKVDMNSMLQSGTRIDDVFTFIVGAVDEDETRTDALMVATMDTKAKSINVMNIPRDTMCNNNQTEASRKINAAYGMKKGIEQTKIEIERIMGFQPDKYVIVNFDGIEAIVDAIGGVEYEVPFRMEYDDPSQDLHIDLYAGNQTLNGKKTVEFLRWRHNNDYSMQYQNGDEGRVETQQQFMKAVAKQVLQMKNVPKIKEIANAVFENVKTDFTAGELLWMGMQAVQFDANKLQFFTLPGYGQMSTAGTSLPLSFFFPYEKETLELVNKYFNPFEEPIANLDIVSGPAGDSGGSYYTDYDSDENYVWGDTSGSYNDSDEENKDDQEENNQTSTNTGRHEYNSGGSGSSGNSGNRHQWSNSDNSDGDTDYSDYNDNETSSPDHNQNNSNEDYEDDNNGYDNNDYNDNNDDSDGNYTDNDNDNNDDNNDIGGDSDSNDEQNNNDNNEDANNNDNSDSNGNEDNQDAGGDTGDPEGEQASSEEPTYADETGNIVESIDDGGETSDPEE